LRRPILNKNYEDETLNPGATSVELLGPTTPRFSNKDPRPPVFKHGPTTPLSNQIDATKASKHYLRA